MTIATRPLPERDADNDISPIAKIKNKSELRPTFFLKIRNAGPGNFKTEA